MQVNEFRYKFSQWWWKDEGLVGRQNILSTILSLHCLKSVQMRSFSWPVFSCIRTEYGDSWSKSSYSVQIQENKDYKKLRIWTLHVVVVIPVDLKVWYFYSSYLTYLWMKGILYSKKNLSKIEKNLQPDNSCILHTKTLSLIINTTKFELSELFNLQLM